MDVVPIPLGTWGASWETLSQGPDAIQRDALSALIRAVVQLGGASILIAVLSLTLHTVSRILTSWHSLAIRCALGATLRHLMAMVGRDLAVLGATGCTAGALGGAAIVAALDATWPALLTRPPHLAAIALAVLLSLLVVMLLLGTIALVLLASLQRGLVPTIARLHGEHVTPSGPLILAQSTAAVLQLAALLVVTYGSVLFLRNSTLFEAGTAARPAVTTPIASLALSGPAAESTAVRASIVRRITPGLAITSPGAQLGLGRRLPVLAVCGECFIGPKLIPMTAATVRVIAVRLTPADTLGAPLVAVLNEAAAWELYPGASPIGKTLRASLDSLGTYTVVGVVPSASPRGIGNRGNEPAIMYVSLLQHPPTIGEVTAPRSVWDSILALSGVVADASRIQPTVGSARSLADRLADFAAPLDWFGGLCIGLAATATGIASYSLAAVMNQMIRIRERDIAIRVALGATPRDVERWVTRHTLAITFTGVTLGLAVARWVGTLLREKAAQSVEGDVLLLGVMVLVFGVLGIVASWIPARRAARVLPAQLGS